MIVGGRDFSLTKDEIEFRMRGMEPETIQKHAVEVNGQLFPPKQVLGVVTGWERSSYTTTEAQRVLTKLGFACIEAPGSPWRQVGETLKETVRDAARQTLHEHGDVRYLRGFKSATGIALSAIQERLDTLREEMKGQGLGRTDQAIYAHLEELKLEIERNCDQFWHGIDVDWRPVRPVTKRVVRYELKADEST